MYENRQGSWWRPGELHLQGTLDGFVEPAVDGAFARLRRIHLDECAWNGDLLVMGGSCPSTWGHRVPKVRRAEPRVSIAFRHRSRLRSGVPGPTAIPVDANVAR